MEAKRIPWVNILITAAITLVVTVGSALIISGMQNRNPRLNYATNVTNSFQGSDRNFAVYNVSVFNPGKVAIRGVVAVFIIPSAQLEEIQITADPALEYTKETVDDTFRLKIPELNPHDTVGVSILATSQAELPSTPEISARGSGVVGVKTDLSDRENSLALWLTSAVIAASIASVATSFLTMGKIRSMEKLRKKLSPSQHRSSTPE